jgi:lipopolysaccharide export system protein LptA
MRPGLHGVLLAGALITGVACGRSGGPRPTIPATPVVDSLAERQARDSTMRAREDSITAAADAPVTSPAITPPSIPPRDSSTPTPERRCVLDLVNTSETSMQMFQDPVTGKRFTYLGKGLVGRCRGQNITIIADSAESYEVNDLHILIGNVRYREAKYAIDAKRVTYFKAEERLLFQDSVHAVLTQESATLDGPQLEYFRAVSGVRDRERIVATQRPILTYIEKDSLGRDQPPVTIIANTIVGQGDSVFNASGEVRIERTDLLATGDSAMIDGARRFSRLMKQPVVESRGGQPFTLKGRVIDVFGEARRVDRVLSIDSASAVSRDFTVISDTLDLRIVGQKLDRAFAFGPNGAQATTPDRDIIADSLDIIMPGQQIRELRAIGKAFAESDPEPSRVTSDERDWIRGDTLIARFDSLAPADTTQPPIRDLYAAGEASAFYQVSGDSGTRSKPGINYVTGRVIRLAFVDREVGTVTVTDQASGVYLLPAADSAARRPATSRPPASGAASAPVRRPPQSQPWRPERWRQ